MIQSLPSSRRNSVIWADVDFNPEFANDDQVLPPLNLDFINEINRNIEEVNEDLVAYFDNNLKYLE